MSASDADWDFLPENLYEFENRKVKKANFLASHKEDIKTILLEADGSRSKKRRLMRSLIRQACRSQVQYKLALRSGVMVGTTELDKLYKAEIEKLGGEKSAREFLIEKHISVEVFQEDLFKRALISKWIDEVILADITLSDEILRNYFNKNKDQFKRPKSFRLHFLFAPKEEGKGEAIGDWHQFIALQLAQGRTIKELEKEFSFNLFDKEKVWWTTDELSPIARMAVETIREKSLSKPVEFSGRKLVIYCSKVRPEGFATFADTKEKLRKYLSYKLVEKRLELLLKDSLAAHLKILF